jgi:hypothetical protein
MSENKKRNRKIILLVVISLFLLASITITLICGYIPLSVSIISRTIEREIIATGIDSCSIGQTKITYWKNTVLYDITVKDSSSRNSAFTIKIDSLTIHGNFLGFLLTNTKSPINSPQKSQNTSFTNTTGIVSRFAEYLRQSGQINRIVCIGSNLQIIEPGNSKTKWKNFYFDLKQSSDSLSFYSGSFAIDSLLTHNVIQQKVKGNIDIRKNDFAINNCTGVIYDGSYTFSGRLSVFKNELSDVSIDCRKFNLNDYYHTAYKNQGEVKGFGSIKMNIRTTDLRFENPLGNGIFIAESIFLTKIPIQLMLIKLLNLPQLDSISFSRVTTDFVLKSNDTMELTMSGTGDIMTFTTVGWINENGALDQNVEGMLTSSFVRKLPGFVTGSMERTADGGRTFKCRIYGTVAQPKMELDQKTLRNTVTNLFENMKQNIQEMFKR